MCKNDRNCVAYNHDIQNEECISYNNFAASGNGDTMGMGGRGSNMICYTREIAPRIFNEPWIRFEGQCSTWSGGMNNIRNSNRMDQWECQDMCKNDRNCVAYNHDPRSKECISYSSFAARGEVSSSHNHICYTREIAARPFNEPWIRFEGQCATWSGGMNNIRNRDRQDKW
jgi:hypothetical protein